MVDFLYSIDKALFIFLNCSIANPVFDCIMPFLTDLNQHWYGLMFFFTVWVLLIWKGGKKGKIIGISIILLILISDQLSSNFIKKIFERPRPCHQVNGIPIVEQIRLLVPCGSGFSFPSSHATNNFAVAFFLSHYYRKYACFFLVYASIIGFSRISVGVHYPSDILGGAIIGGVLAGLFIIAINYLSSQEYSKMKF